MRGSALCAHSLHLLRSARGAGRRRIRAPRGGRPRDQSAARWEAEAGGKLWGDTIECGKGWGVDGRAYASEYKEHRKK
jgi:hypothetical protein